MIFVSDIQRAVARFYDIPIEAMREPDSFGSRAISRSHPRQVAMYLSRSLCRVSLSCGRQNGHVSYPSIGKRFNRDHTTVMHAIMMVKRRRRSDPMLRIAMRQLSRQLQRQDR